jgi:hypothetical protein
MQTQVERRTNRRFRLSLPLIAKLPERGDIRAHTRDVSSRGVCFSSPAPLPVGTALQFIMTLPSEVTLSIPLRVRCSGHVIRTEDQQGRAEVTIAAVIDHYDFLAD